MAKRKSAALENTEAAKTRAEMAAITNRAFGTYVKANIAREGETPAQEGNGKAYEEVR